MEKYFVATSGDTPDKLFFDLDSAIEFGSSYIDIFDADGIYVGALEWNCKSGEYQ